ncbi:sialoadhesin-like [Centropristis striata]|uniref:sialoadhesin-like n=1 Tax=Centropristis striata TaxID=184440 RepID=UPI0027E01982|nr:sialoadhesin-like [Centropristis striata]
MLNRMLSPHELAVSRSEPLPPADSMLPLLLSVSISPPFSQFYEYDNVLLSCNQLDSGNWTVWRYTTGGFKPSECGKNWGVWTMSICTMKTVKPTDSGVYWCQSQLKDSSNTISISVTDSKVILQSPALPVEPGHDVTLHCKTKKSSSLDFRQTSFETTPGDFFRGSSRIRTQSASHIIRNFSRSDEGVYRCQSGGVDSPTSWLLIKDDSEPASLTPFPDLAQLFEYENLFLSCGFNSSFSGWKVVRSNMNPICGEKYGKANESGCHITTGKEHDSATYWCESPTKQRSNSLDITLYDKKVTLQIPVLPVMEGHDVTLRCKKRNSSDYAADFFKDGSLISTAPEGHMTIRHVSRSDEGLYKCNISGVGVSPSSRLLVRSPHGAAGPAAEPTPLLLTVMRHLLVVFPYCSATALMLSVYRRRSPGRKQPVSMTMSPTSGDDDPNYDDVDADVTTEHHF